MTDAQVFSAVGLGVALTIIAGVYCLVTTRNLIRALIGLEILTKGVTLLIIVAGYVANQIGLAAALAITLIVIEVAIVVVAVGIVLCFYRQTNSIDATALRNLKG